MTTFLALMAFAGCSLQRFDFTPCTQDADCISEKWAGDTCLPDGFCGVAEAASGPFVSVFLSEVLPGRFTDSDESRFHGYAATVTDDGGIRNLAQCALAPFGLCVETYPSAGLTAPLDPARPDFGSWQSIDGGDIVAASTFLEYSPVARHNEGTPSRLTSPGNLEIGGGLGGALPAFASDDAFEVVGDLDVLEPAPDRTILVDLDDQITFRWTPTGSGEMFLEVDDLIIGLNEAAGSVTLPVSDLGLPVNKYLWIERFTVNLARIRAADIDAAGSLVRMQTRRDQLWHLDQVASAEVDRMVDGVQMADDCTAALALAPLQAGYYYGSLQAYDDDMSVDEANPFTKVGSTGKDAFVRLDLEASQTLTFLYYTPFDDGVVYLLDSCADPTPWPLMAANGEGWGIEDELEYTAPRDQTLILGLDAFVDDKLKAEGRTGDSFSLDFLIDGRAKISPRGP
ncbi:MAG: hypothetical protein KTR31_10220 [Myxococcales bacterium]|nr:hypothetical protein [Myxococcales bacterium]